ncbi:unnamed protein product, partial [Heterosigma akashiwo]
MYQFELEAADMASVPELAVLLKAVSDTEKEEDKVIIARCLLLVLAYC